ncbi:CMRF35-like molecule 2 [Myotis brandtii]|uniref:CMRF35-like molecule 2 n=1 Tax=Myotis brandtii TaxID=109478 RepID=S7MIL8_MYOBR|nr:CMRF35-like molecule 2 [Myotis brandtii]
MGLFVLLSLTVLSEAMVMDKKVKESFVLDTVSAVCSYGAHYKDHLKYWCRGYYRDYCNIIAFTPNSTGRVALRDTGEQLIVTVSCLTKEDAGWYWCGIQRDFARDDMDFTELVVTDYRGAHTSDFWSVKGKGHARGLCGGALQGWLSEQSAVSRSLDLTPCRVPFMPLRVVPLRDPAIIHAVEIEGMPERDVEAKGGPCLALSKSFLMQMRQGT